MKRISVYSLCAKFCYLFLSGVWAFSCSDFERGIPVGDEKSPIQITDVNVTEIPGGATFTYSLPPDNHVLYVMAEYTLRDGVLRNQKSSHFGNTITLEGFPDTSAYEVNLYSVSHSGIKSEPVRKTIVPLTPPYLSAHDSLKLEPTFGGMKINFENPHRANLKYIVVTADSVGGEYYQTYTHYTKIEKGSFAVRGFAATKRIFGIYTLDRWDNRSDTLFTEIVPWFEQQLDKNLFVNAKLPSDVYDPHMNASYSLEAIWNDIWGTTGGFHSKPNTGIPQWFTIDLGVSARLSRMKFYHRLNGSSTTDGQYNSGDPQVFEIYGSNTLTDEWDDHWVLLGHFESIKPSGAAGFTDEDVQYACHQGEDFDFINNEPFRYLRFKTLKTWGGLTYIYIAELSFWGEVLKGN